MPEIKVRISATTLGRFSSLVITLQMLLTIAVIIGFCFGRLRFPDIWWQLSEGQQILADRRLTSGPLNAFGLHALPFINEYAIYEILIALLHSVTGMPGLRVFFGLLNFLPFALVGGLWLRRRNGFTFTYWSIWL